MSAAKAVKAASHLLRCVPPHKTPMALKSILRLRANVTARQRAQKRKKPRAETTDDDEERAFLEDVLASDHQRLVPTSCKNLTKCGRSFIPVEYCRDGDGYRCPWCNKVSQRNNDNGDGDAESAATTPTYPLSRIMRRLEKRLNEQFGEYGRQYYGPHCVMSAYIWPNEDMTKVGCAVLFAHELASSPQDDQAAAPPPSCWNSTHIFSIEAGDMPLMWRYTASSTVFMDVTLMPCHCSGFVSKQTTVSERHVGETDLFAHAVHIGEIVQEVENRLLDEVTTIYFAKSSQVATEMRTAPASGSGGVATMGAMVMPAAVNDNKPTKSSERSATEELIKKERKLDLHQDPTQPSRPVRDAVAAEEERAEAKRRAKREKEEEEAAAAERRRQEAEAEASAAAQREEAQASTGTNNGKVWYPALDDDGAEYFYDDDGEVVWELPEGDTVDRGDGTAANETAAASSSSLRQAADVSPEPQQAATATTTTNVWYADTTEDGDVYYWNDEGGMEWDLPKGATVAEAPPKKSKKDKKEKKKDKKEKRKEEEQTEQQQGANEDEAAEETTAVTDYPLREVLGVLSLSQDVEEYLALFKSVKITKTKHFLRCSAEYLEEIGVEHEKDRKRMVKWITRNAPQEEEEA